MLTISPQYEGFYGAIEPVGKSSIQTLFYQFMGFPIFPQGTYWVTGSALTSWDKLKVTELRRSVPSIVIGYLRGWLTSGSAWVTGAGLFLAIVVKEPLFLGDPMLLGRTAVGAVLTVLGVLGLLAAIVLRIASRRPLSDDELARRAVFAQITGSGCDPALLVNPWSMRDDLKRSLASIGEAMQLGRTYDLFNGWATIAQRPDLPLPAEYLRMAMTVARLERGTPAEGTNIAALPAIEQAIWQRLCALDPSARTARPA